MILPTSSSTERSSSLISISWRMTWSMSSVEPEPRHWIASSLALAARAHARKQQPGATQQLVELARRVGFLHP